MILRLLHPIRSSGNTPLRYFEGSLNRMSIRAQIKGHKMKVKVVL